MPEHNRVKFNSIQREIGGSRARLIRSFLTDGTKRCELQATSATCVQPDLHETQVAAAELTCDSQQLFQLRLIWQKKN